MAETFYLSSLVSKEIKDLSALTDWELEVARLLLNTALGTDEKSEKIRALLPSSDYVETGPLVRSLMEMLPKNIQSRSKIFLHYFLPKVNLADGGIVELPDGTPTAPLVDILRYFCSPAHLKVSPPLGLVTLQTFLSSIGMPASAYGSKRQETYYSEPKRWISL